MTPPAAESPAAEPVVAANEVAYSYGERRALEGISFEVRAGEIVGFLGPNGSGKSTLFHLLSTLFPPQSGTLTLGGLDVAREAAAVRAKLGVVFQRPSLDPKLTVAENIRYQGALYGLGGGELRMRCEATLSAFGLAERAGDLAETLSGGLKRRVELAKSLLHEPEVLLLDEPSTGLDPAAVGDLWEQLARLQQERGMTILVTTHHMEEAEQCDRLALVDAGRIVAMDTPSALKATVEGQSVSIRCAAPDELAARLNGIAGGDAPVVSGGAIRLATDDGAALVARLLKEHGDEIDEITVGRASLRDVFLRKTGHAFDGGAVR